MIQSTTVYSVSAVASRCLGCTGHSSCCCAEGVCAIATISRVTHAQSSKAKTKSWPTYKEDQEHARAEAPAPPVVTVDKVTVTGCTRVQAVGCLVAMSLCIKRWQSYKRGLHPHKFERDPFLCDLQSPCPAALSLSRVLPMVMRQLSSSSGRLAGVRQTAHRLAPAVAQPCTTCVQSLRQHMRPLTVTCAVQQVSGGIRNTIEAIKTTASQ
jgi:hypothetical protein